MERKINYDHVLEDFEEFLNAKGLILMPKDKKESEIFKLISGIKSEQYLGRKIDNINFHFLEAINILGEDIRKFYEEQLQSITLHRAYTMGYDDACLLGDKRAPFIVLTSKPLRERSFVLYSHELGHIPDKFEDVRGEYFEYIETFPIFLEYLACKEINTKNTFELFKKIRFSTLDEMSKEYNKNIKKIAGNDSSKDKYLEIENRRILKYIVSLEVALQLIDRIENDKKGTKEELTKYVLREKSMREVGEKLDINPQGYKKLIKNIKKNN